MHYRSKDHCSRKYDVPLRQRQYPFPRYSHSRSNTVDTAIIPQSPLPCGSLYQASFHLTHCTRRSQAKCAVALRVADGTAQYCGLVARCYDQPCSRHRRCSHVGCSPTEKATYLGRHTAADTLDCNKFTF